MVDGMGPTVFPERPRVFPPRPLGSCVPARRALTSWTGAQVFGADLAMEALGLEAEQKGVDLVADCPFGPNAVLRLKQLQDFFIIRGQRVDRPDAGLVKALGGFVLAEGGHGGWLSS